MNSMTENQSVPGPMWRETLSASGWLGGWAARLSRLTGWRRRGMAVLLGVLAALALPPVGLVPVLLISLPGLIWLLDGASSRRAAFGTGWWWGLGWYSAGFYWIAHALLIDPVRFGWMIPFATLGLGGFVAIFLGLVTLFVRLAGVSGAGRVVMLAGAWTVADWSRNWAFTGFPWNPVGSVWDGWLPIMQAASWVGVFGLSFLTVLVLGMPAILADFASARRKAALLLSVTLLLVLVALMGAVRLGGAEETSFPGIRLRLVQAAIPQTNKWRDDLRERHLLDQLDLSRSPGWEKVTHIIWPETAATFVLDQDARHRALVAGVAPPGGMVLTGAPRTSVPGTGPFEIWNSMLAIDGAGLVQGIYDKVHLVPFGEYVPLRTWLSIGKLTNGGADFSEGPGLRTLSLPGLPPVSVLICYEVIFPGNVVGADQPRPDWLLTITNDGWFGYSAGPFQHMASARMRAVEEGLPLVRAANTGISGVVDPFGRVVAQLGLEKRGFVDADLPRPLPPTLFSRYGNTIPLLLSFLACLGIWTLSKIRSRRP